MAKQLTIRYYTDSGMYKGWEYLKNASYLSVSNWIRSGNSVMIEKNVFNWVNKTKLLTGVYRHYLK